MDWWELRKALRREYDAACREIDAPGKTTEDKFYAMGVAYGILRSLQTMWPFYPGGDPRPVVMATIPCDAEGGAS